MSINRERMTEEPDSNHSYEVDEDDEIDMTEDQPK